MSKFIKNLMIIAATISLSACSGQGKVVSREKFKEKAENVEPHPYSSATVSVNLKGNYLGTTNTVKGDVIYIFDGNWHYELCPNELETINYRWDGIISSTANIVATNGFVSAYSSIVWKIEPFSLEMKDSFSGIDEEMVPSEGNLRIIYKWNKYGLLTYYYSSYSKTLNYQGQKINSSESFIISISYK